MTIAVINSPLFEYPLEGYTEDSLPPLGQGYILHELKKLDIPIQFLDAFAQNFGVKETLQWIVDISPSFVIMNIFSSNISVVEKIIVSLPNSVQVILGGGTLQIRNEIMKWKWGGNLFIVEGEGELAVPAIIQNKVKEFDFCIENFRVIHVSSRSEYFPHNISDSRVNHTFFANEPLFHHHGMWEAYLSTSRGCVYNCAYCSSARSRNVNFPVRERSVDSIREEISDLISVHPEIQAIRILDDLFLRNRESVSRAVDIFRDFNLTWRAMAHILSISQLDNFHLQQLKSSGCKELFIGIESGSKRILDLIHKVSNTQTIYDTICKLLDIGIDVKGFFIIGFPTEESYEMEETYLLAKRLFEYSVHSLGKFRTSVFQFRPYHGTELYEALAHTKMIHNIPNQDLSGSIGRKQFNVSSGNYSNVSDDVMMKYIIEINNLHQ